MSNGPPAIQFCDAHKAWLATDRKQQPPCGSCAEADSLWTRSRQLERQVEQMRFAAERMVASAHPPRKP